MQSTIRTTVSLRNQAQVRAWWKDIAEPVADWGLRQRPWEALETPGTLEVFIMRRLLRCLPDALRRPLDDVHQDLVDSAIHYLGGVIEETWMKLE